MVAVKSTPLLCLIPFRNTSIKPTSYPPVIVKFVVTPEDVSVCLVIVENGILTVTVVPDPTIVTPAPVNLTSVNPVPTRTDPDWIPTPEMILLSPLPSPINEVAVITPTALIPPARTLIPLLAVTIPIESTFLTSSYVIVPPTVMFPSTY